MSKLKLNLPRAIELRDRSTLIVTLDKVLQSDPARHRYDHNILEKWMLFTREHDVIAFPLSGGLVCLFLGDERLVTREARGDVAQTMEKLRSATTTIFARSKKRGEDDAWRGIVKDSKWRLDDWRCIRELLAGSSIHNISSVLLSFNLTTFIQ